MVLSEPQVRASENRFPLFGTMLVPRTDVMAA
jgi:hypothetical protein